MASLLEKIQFWKKKKEPPKLNYDNIYYDEQGCLRVGNVSFKRKEQRERVLKADNPNMELNPDKEEKFCVIDAAWVKSWLAFVYFNQSSPSPGKIRNTNLITKVGSEWKFKDDLVLEKDNEYGNFRLIKEEVWDIYVSYYKESGPKITVVREPVHLPENWEIDKEYVEEWDSKRKAAGLRTSQS